MRTWTPLLVALALLLPCAAAGQTITIASPGHKWPIHTNSPFLITAESSVNVIGHVTGLPVGQEDEYHIVVNGVAADDPCLNEPTVDLAGWTTSLGPGEAGFRVAAPIGYDPPDWWTNEPADCTLNVTRPPWPYSTPYLPALVNEDRILTPILAELVHDSGEVVARKRITLYDARRYPALDPFFPANTSQEGMASQLTPSGVIGLTPTWESLLPWPGLDALVTDFAAEAHAQASGIQPLTGACFMLTGQSPFAGLREKVEAITLASGLYTAFVAACTPPTLPGACLAANQFMCVQDTPDVADCVRGVDLSVSDAWIDGLGSSALGMGTMPAELTADSVVSGVHADFEGVLRDVEIRYMGGPGTCTDRPVVPVASEDWVPEQRRGWLEQWSTCVDLGLDAAGARRVDAFGQFAPQVYQVNVDAFDDTLLDVQAATAHGFDLQTLTARTGAGTCGDLFIGAQMGTVLNARSGEIAAALTDAWDGPLAPTRESEAMEVLLSTEELGTMDSQLHQDIDLFGVVAGTTNEGLTLTWKTRSDPVGNIPSQLDPGYSVYHPPGSPLVAPVGDDPSGTPFDLSYGVTTGFLNQIIRAQYGTRLLYGRRRPTYNQLGVTSVPGNLNRIARLSPAVLAEVHPALGGINTKKVKIIVVPTMAPFTLMQEDLPPALEGTAKVSYQLGQLLVEVRDQRSSWGSASGLWLRMVLDVWEPDLQATWGDGTDEYLDFSATNPVFELTVLESNLPNCDRRSHAGEVDSCEREVRLALTPALAAITGRRMMMMLGQVPGPQIWDADELGQPVQHPISSGMDWWREAQMITLFGLLAQ
jgi:hypothetical protein